MSKKDEILRARDEGRSLFGVEVKNYTHTSKHFTRLDKYTEMGIEVLPDDKFEILEKMHKRIGEVNGEMDTLCRNQSVA